MRKDGKDERGSALVDGLILLIFLIVVPLLLLFYCGGGLRRVADRAASRFVCRRAGEPCKKAAPPVESAGEKTSAAPSTAVKP